MPPEITNPQNLSLAKIEQLLQDALAEISKIKNRPSEAAGLDAGVASPYAMLKEVTAAVQAYSLQCGAPKPTDPSTVSRRVANLQEKGLLRCTVWGREKGILRSDLWRLGPPFLK